MRHAARAVTWSMAMAALAAACSDGTGPAKGMATVSLAMTTQPGTAPGTANPGLFAAVGTPDTFTLADDTLEFTEVLVVLRDIKLIRAADGDCDDDVAGEEGMEGEENEAEEECEAIDIGPILLDLPLGGGVERVFSADVPADTYRRLKFHIHKPEDDGNARDQALLAEHPDFKKISIRATGTFNGTPFVFETGVNAVQHMDLDPPLVAAGDGPTDLTLKVDLATWFRNRTGTGFIDPSAALDESTRQFINQNIRKSFRAFRDQDHDGDDDDGGDDER